MINTTSPAALPQHSSPAQASEADTIWPARLSPTSVASVQDKAASTSGSDASSSAPQRRHRLRVGPELAGQRRPAGGGGDRAGSLRQRHAGRRWTAAVFGGASGTSEGSAQTVEALLRHADTLAVAAATVSLTAPRDRRSSHVYCNDVRKPDADLPMSAARPLPLHANNLSPRLVLHPRQMVNAHTNSKCHVCTVILTQELHFQTSSWNNLTSLATAQVTNGAAAAAIIAAGAVCEADRYSFAAIHVSGALAGFQPLTDLLVGYKLL